MAAEQDAGHAAAETTVETTVAVGMIAAAGMTEDAEATAVVEMTAAAGIPMAGIITAEEIPTEGILRTGNPADRTIAAVRKSGPAVRKTTAAVTGTGTVTGTAGRLPG